MKQLFILSFTIFIFTTAMQAQTTNISGTYYLEGVRETASGIKLNADSSFEFFFSYGALDRYGSGTWTMENNTVILNSKPYPGKDFKLVDSASDKNSFTTIKIEEKNKALLRYVYCLIKTKNEDSLLNADSEGYIAIADKSINTIQLLFQFCPEKISSFTLNTSINNIFTFNFEPWLFEIFLKNFRLHFVTDHLEGKHPLLDDKNYIYTKNE